MSIDISEENSHDNSKLISVKVTVLGAPGVGKTSLRRNFMGQNFKISYSTTLGVDFANKIVKLEDGTHINFQVWDLAGQLNYIAVTRSFLSNTNAALVVYDATVPETFNHIKAWLKILYDSNIQNASKIPFIVLRNKIDLLEEDIEEPEFIDDEFIRYLDKYEELSPENTKFLPTSAKTGKNVELSFLSISRILKEVL